MNKDKLIKLFDTYGIAYDDERIGLLLSYMHYTLEENKKYNLTAITDESEFLEKMIFDSAIILSKNDLSGKKIIDVGTGAGYPGMVLKILNPDTDLFLLDSTNKKIEFIKRFALANNICVSAVCDRAELYARNHVEQFDVVVARAVASLPILLEIVAPLLKVGGEFLALKSRGYKEELDLSEKALSKLFLDVTDIEEYDLPESMEKRVIIHIKKLKPTPKKYPREYNQIKKQPL